MITTYLIIGHLLNDFLLQPYKLIQWKMKNFTGVLVHVLLLAGVSAILLFPYLGRWETWAVIGGISVVHFITDLAKINIALKYDNFPLPYIADQAIHFISILIGGGLLARMEFSLPNSWFYENVYSNVWVWVACLAVIFIGYMVSIFFLQTKRLVGKTVKGTQGNIPFVSRSMKILLFVFVYIAYFSAAVLLGLS
ncbi:DUF3307 domain-containing protein [Patescibacteria group bacterium]